MIGGIAHAGVPGLPCPAGAGNYVHNHGFSSSWIPPLPWLTSTSLQPNAEVPGLKRRTWKKLLIWQTGSLKVNRI